MSRLFSAWDRFWFVEGPAHGLASFRILLGGYWLVRWLVLLPDVRLLFSGEGMYFPLILPGTQDLDSVGRLFGALTPPAPVPVAWLLYLAALGSAVMMMLGRSTRTAVLCQELLVFYHYLLYMHPLNSSFDRMLFIITGLLILSPCGNALSLDARRLAAAQGNATPRSYPLWTQRAICFQVMLIYLGTGLFKVASDAWSSGMMISTSWMGDWATPLGFAILRLNPGERFFDLLVLGTIVFELCAPLLLFNVRWQRYFFVLAFFFHLGNAVILDIWQFMFLPLTYVLFLPPEDARSLVEQVRRRGAATLSSRSKDQHLRES